MGADAAWDMVVVGGGTAGMVAARTAARLGARTLLVEADRPGGDCLWTGCVPSKALIASAAAAHAARASAALGVIGTVDVDFAAVMRHVHGAIARIAPTDSVEMLERSGVQVITGTARFIDSTSVEVDGRKAPFHRAVIAAGASARLPRIAGIDDVAVLTSDTFWAITSLPARLLVMGGGPVGCEIAQAMARLGSAVTLVHRASRLLPAEDVRASALVQAALEADGVDVMVGCEVIEFEAPTSRDTAEGLFSLALVQSLASGEVHRVVVDRVFAATGRAPRTRALGLDLAGVETDADGAVIVSANLRTSHPRIWAAGDVTALPRYTHTASANGEIAATNALTSSTREVDPVVARVTYTSPEVASVSAAAVSFTTLTVDHADLDRGIVDGQTAGFTSIDVDDRGIVCGATIVGPRAGETLGELALAVRLALTTEQLALTTHAYPGYGYAVRKLAMTDMRARAPR